MGAKGVHGQRGTPAEKTAANKTFSQTAEQVANPNGFSASHGPLGAKYITITRSPKAGHVEDPNGLAAGHSLCGAESNDSKHAGRAAKLRSTRAAEGGPVSQQFAALHSRVGEASTNIKMQFAEGGPVSQQFAALHSRVGEASTNIKMQFHQLCIKWGVTYIKPDPSQQASAIAPAVVTTIADSSAGPR